MADGPPVGNLCFIEYDNIRVLPFNREQKKITLFYDSMYTSYRAVITDNQRKLMRNFLYFPHSTVPIYIVVRACCLHVYIAPRYCTREEKENVLHAVIVVVAARIYLRKRFLSFYRGVYACCSILIFRFIYYAYIHYIILLCCLKIFNEQCRYREQILFSSSSSVSLPTILLLLS